MFIHNFSYSFKVLFRNKTLVFWTFSFPIIMAFLFNMAFSNIQNDEKLKVFPIAIVENEELQKNQFIRETFDILGDPTKEDQLFDVKYISLEEAKKLLDQDEITGYLKMQEDIPKVVVKKSGINETIFQNVVKEINQNKKIVEDMIASKIEEQMKQGNTQIDAEAIYAQSIQAIQKESISNIKDHSSSKLDNTMIEYYTLIAMACLYGAMLSMTVINNLLPDMSKKGMRVNVAPTTKMKMILSSALASFLIQCIGVAILFLFTIFVIHVDYGEDLLRIILLALVGCFAGLSMGVLVGTMIKKNENTKIGVLIATIMLGCFLSGMMGISMKYTVDTSLPIVNQMNPASMITDGFYSLYYYTTMDRYWFNVASLIVFSVVLLAISTITLRRQKYDSI